ncbi:MAG: hypothetical protein OCD76_01130 [Reichenbachiella sp.]
MNKITLLRTLYWIFFAGAIYLFYVSIRIEHQQMEYSLAALAVWLMMFGINWLWKREKAKEE